jgi:hypothetical protein
MRPFTPESATTEPGAEQTLARLQRAINNGDARAVCALYSSVTRLFRYLAAAANALSEASCVFDEASDLRLCGGCAPRLRAEIRRRNQEADAHGR